MSEWTDSEGNSLGEWVEIDRDEYWRIYGTGEDLTVFSTLTDPEGQYGSRQIYTAWGYLGEDAPLIDIRDFKGEDGSTERQVCRKFVAVSVMGSGKVEVDREDLERAMKGWPDHNREERDMSEAAYGRLRAVLEQEGGGDE